MNPIFPTKEKIAFSQTFKIEAFRKHTRHTEPHKHKNYFEVIFLWQGSGTHLIDETLYEIVSPTIFILKKDQIHAWDITSEPEGYVLIIKDEFVNQLKDNELKVLFHLFWRTECLLLHEPTVIRQLFELLEKEAQVGQMFGNAIVEGLLKSILAKILQYQSHQLPDKKYLALYTQFLNLLITKQLYNQKTAEFAQQLNVSAEVLNEICKKTVGKSAKELIVEFTIAEAKRYLRYTPLTITEIAYQLQFNDASYFVKFFKQHTQLTPETYRNQA